MPVETYWYTGKCVICSRIIGDITADDMAQYRADVNELMAEGMAPYVLMIDTSQHGKMPSNFKETLLRMDEYRNNPLIDRTLVISTNSLMNFISVLASKVFGIPLHIFKSMDEADQFLARHLPMLEAQQGKS